MAEQNKQAKTEEGSQQDETKANKNNTQKNPSMKLLGALKTVPKRAMIRNLPALWTDNLTIEELEWLLFFVVTDRGFAVDNVCVTRSRGTGVFCGVVDFMHERDVQRFVDGLDKRGQFFVGEWGVYLSAFRMLENNNNNKRKEKEQLKTPTPPPPVPAKKEEEEVKKDGALTEKASNNNTAKGGKNGNVEIAVADAKNELEKENKNSGVEEKAEDEKSQNSVGKGKENDAPFETTTGIVYSREQLLSIRTASLKSRLSASAVQNISAIFQELRVMGKSQRKTNNNNNNIDPLKPLENNKIPVSKSSHAGESAEAKKKTYSVSSPIATDAEGGKMSVQK